MNARETIDEVTMRLVAGGRAKQEGGLDDFSFTQYTEFKGNREELVDAIERALYANGLLAVNVINTLERAGHI